MSAFFQPLPLSEWQGTRDTLAEYTRFVRRIRQHNTTRQKHWWHVSLRPITNGLTTTPIRAADGTIYELIFDFPRHSLIVLTSTGESREVSLHGFSQKAFKEDTLAALAELGVTPEYGDEAFDDDSPCAYDEDAVERFWQTLIETYTVLREFRNTFIEETSPVQFWPHHFDLAVVWFSGRTVPDEDPIDPEHANEQMNFGFSTGDSGIAEPYFYATAYPVPAGWTDNELPDGAYWHSDGWTGGVLPYERVVAAGAEGRQLLLDFFFATQNAGAQSMLGEFSAQTED